MHTYIHINASSDSILGCKYRDILRMELAAYKAVMRIFKHYLIGRDKDRTNIKRCKEMFGARSIQHIVHIEKSHTFFEATIYLCI